MTLNVRQTTHRNRLPAWAAAALALALTATGLAFTPTRADAIGVAVDLGTAGNFAVLAGQTVTNTGPSVLTGDLGVSPGTAVTGFPPGTVNGAVHAGDAVAGQAQSDLTTAYNNAAGQAVDATISANLGGQTLDPGVYSKASDTTDLNGALTLDAHGDPNAVFIFKLSSTLITSSNSSVVLVNGAQPCDVFWQVSSSATIATGTTFVGNILALTSITVQTGATIDGRALARNGAVTLDDNVITRQTCSSGGTTGGTTTGGTATGGTTTGGTTTGGTTGGTTTGGTTGGTTTGGTTAGTTGGTTAGTTGGTTAGTTGGTTAGTTGGTTGGTTTGGTTTAGTTGGTTGGTIGGTSTGGVATGGTTGGQANVGGGHQLAHTGTNVLYMFPLAIFLLIGGALLYRRRAPRGR